MEPPQFIKIVLFLLLGQLLVLLQEDIKIFLTKVLALLLQEITIWLLEKAGENGVVSLGDGGSAILTFSKPIKNETGWDFAIF